MKPCGNRGVCKVINLAQMRTVMCECPPGYTGNAYEKCTVVTEKQPGCQYDADCPIFEACIKKQCENPCNDQPCAAGAVCRATSHRPICYCPSGYTGDGYNACSHLECNAEEECPDDSICFNNRCVDACTVSRPCGTNAKCHTSQHTTVCQCDAGYSGEPYISCATMGCRTDSSCPSTHSCLNGICVNQCIVNNPCDTTQICNTNVHQVNCSCPPNYDTVGGVCVPSKPGPKPSCSSDQECDSGTACLNGTCQDLCKKEPCGHKATCTVQSGHSLVTVLCQCGPGLTGDPFRQCVPVPTPTPGCRSQSDCPSDKTCVGGRCADPCQNSPCAPGATCRAIGHRGVCSCVIGYHGDPRVLCTPGQ